MTVEPHRIAAQFFNRPLLLTEPSARTIGNFLLSRFEMRRGGGGDEDSGSGRQFFRPTPGPDGTAEVHSSRASRFVGDYRIGPDGRPTPYRVTTDGTAVITIVGELVNRGAWVGASSGLVSYEGVKHSLSTAAKDPQVSAILLDIESPGGEAVGCFEVAKLVRQVRQEKPVIAVVNGMACSAAYAIASGASRIVTTPTGLSGSIGVVMLHIDISEALASEGIVPTLIFAGNHKVDGNPYEPLPENVRGDFQRDIDAFYGLFVETVSAGRRRMTAAAVRATEARVYMGADAQKSGLVDEVATFEEVVAALASPQSRSAVIGRTMTQSRGLPTMSDSTADPKATVIPPAATTQEQAADASPTMTIAEALAQVTGAPPPQNPAASVVSLAPAASAPAAPAAPVQTQPAQPAAAAPSASDTVSRADVQAIITIAAQADRLGVKVDAAAAIAKGISPDALRNQVLTTAAARDEASAVIATTTAPPRTAGAKEQHGKSPLLTLAEQQAGIKKSA